MLCSFNVPSDHAAGIDRHYTGRRFRAGSNEENSAQIAEALVIKIDVPSQIRWEITSIQLNKLFSFAHGTWNVQVI